MNHIVIFEAQNLLLGRINRRRAQPRKPPRRKRLLRRKRSSLGVALKKGCKQVMTPRPRFPGPFSLFRAFPAGTLRHLPLRFSLAAEPGTSLPFRIAAS